MPDAHNCDVGWVCERHPDLAWQHDDCNGAGQPCAFPGCEDSMLYVPPVKEPASIVINVRAAVQDDDGETG